MSMRVPSHINARLDAATREKLDLIRRRTRQSSTEIVITSLDLYYRALKGDAKSAKETLDRTGFVGCGEAEPELSTNYKAFLASSLTNKT